MQIDQRSGTWSALLAFAAVLSCLAASPAHTACPTSNLLFTATGAAAGDALGFAVSHAGDVNGDGYGDVIVGAYGNDHSGSDAGRAYVYYGGPFADSTADVVLTGEVAGDAFGQSVSGAGDVNGDDFDDVIVGAPYNDAHGNASGKAYVYFGGVSPDSTPDLVLEGPAAGDFFGYSVAGAGDVNHDGFADVIVGAYGGASPKPGRALVYYGGAVPNAIPDLTLTGAAGGDNFGVSVAGAGDVNRDGFDDVVIGARLNDAGGMDAGRAYVYYGGDPANPVADLVLTGEAPDDVFGTTVSGAGDFNRDGFDDVIVGAPYNDAGGGLSGRAYVYYGGSSPDATPDFVVNSNVVGDLFGNSVSKAGDMNGDGYDEVLIGSYTNDFAGNNAGRAYVYFGSATPVASPTLSYAGAAPGDNFGYSVSGGGDVNGDGHSDLVVGAPANDAGGLGAGRAYVLWLRIAEVVVDGTAEASYGPPVVVQSIQTQYGNATSGMVDFTNGSELDQAFARFTPRALCLLIAGNLESNYKKLDIFLDTRSGEGQNRLRGDNPNIDSGGLNRLGDDGSGNGLRFDSGFEPDYYITVTGGDTGGGRYEIFVNWAELLTGGGGLGRFLGRTGAVSGGVLQTGDNPEGIRVTINNSNTAGVTAGAGASSGAGVNRGVELWIPLSAIGCPTGCFRIAAFVNGPFYDLVSNQVLGPLPVGTLNLGDPRAIDFSAISGSQFFSVCREDNVSVPAAPASDQKLFARASPNPFYFSTELRFSLPEPGATRIEAYNVAGQRVARLLDRSLDAGSHAVTWRGTDAAGRPLAPGIYYLRMESRGVVTARKVVKLR